jgi:hypothetical protein
MPRLLACLLALCLSNRLNAAPPREGIEWFETQIRPILVESCYECHSARSGEVEGGLRLDSAAGILRGGDGGEIIVAGRPEASRLLAALMHEDLEMPPSGRLSERVINDFRHWIERGAALPPDSDTGDADGTPSGNWHEHWAFQPIARPALPDVGPSDWCKSPIDAFVLARLYDEGLSPSPAADRRTLIRRLYFDLIGLPPTADEIDRFVADTAPDAVVTLVDRLLSSPQYGERWGRHWLDVARYADTKDLVLKFGPDRIRPYTYTYRDYVVNAWNQDLPFDRFVHEQLAADLLEPTNRSALAALGLLNIGRLFDDNLPDIHDDRIDVVTRGFMGLTVTCARCHDHKYDPIPTADYYSLYGVFASCETPLELPLVDLIKQTDEVAAFERQAGEVRQRLVAHLDTQYAQLLSEAQQRVTDYLVKIATSEPEYLETTVFYLSLSPEDLRPQIISRWRRYVNAHSGPDDPVFGLWGELLHRGDADGDFATYAAQVLKRWNDVPTGTSAGEVNPLVLAQLSAGTLQSADQVAQAYGTAFLQALQRWQDASERTDQLDTANRQLVELLVAPSGPVFFSRQHAYLYMSRVPRGKFEEMKDELDKLAVTSAAAPPRAMTVVDSPIPYESRIFLRGNPNTPGRPVPRRFLSALDENQQPFGEGSGRRELAEAITSAVNPLTSRVIVNRMWMHHFGEPLVATPSDFGLRGDPPSHPRLLDYLAWTLQREDGWSIKKLHRRIVLSGTYQQASMDRPACRERDPENRWFWRAHRRRLDFEAMRDTMLVVSSRLNRQLGGRPVDVAGDAENRRRTLYGLVDRQELPSDYRAFDFASPDQSASRRPRTTSPQQALFGLNSAFVLTQSRSIAEWLMAQPGSDRQHIQQLYRKLLARAANEDELASAQEYVQGLSTDGDSDRLNRWTQLAQLLLLTNEFMFID